MSSAQLDALLDWLTQLEREGNTQPKFIFTGSVVAPVERCNLGHSLWMRDDGLAGYPADLTTVVRHIVEHEIERVVFVSGDLHLSCTAELVLKRCSDSKQVRATQIVASALYAPFKFANTRACDVDFGAPATIALDGYAIDYVPTLLTDIPAHFVKVAAEPGNADWSLSVTAYDPDANAVARTVLKL
jgi:phosphodiesterase/alkaline phosphatase D-like protein